MVQADTKYIGINQMKPTKTVAKGSFDVTELQYIVDNLSHPFCARALALNIEYLSALHREHLSRSGIVKLRAEFKELTERHVALTAQAKELRSENMKLMGVLAQVTAVKDTPTLPSDMIQRKRKT